MKPTHASLPATSPVSSRRPGIGLMIVAVAISAYGLNWLWETPHDIAAAAPPVAVPIASKPEVEPKGKPLPANEKAAAKEFAPASAKDEDSSSDSAASEAAQNAKAKNITFDTIKFEMEKTDPYDRELIGPKIEALAGKKVRIRGYVHPSSSFSQTMRNFILVRDNQECCFGPGAALFDCIIVKMKPGTTAQYTTSPIAVEGIFRIEELPDPFDEEANPQAIYEMEAEAAK
ncbi:MAG: DUF3299 domain-containing protein [Pirellulales bacterium]